MKSTLAALAAATAVNAGHHAEHHGCFEHVDYPGQDIMKTENVHSAETCQAICRETEGCSTFTWSPSEGFCWSKYVAANEIEHEGRVSGPAFCGEIIVEPTPEGVMDDLPCVEEGIDYFGNDVKSSDNVHSLEDCKALCQETEGCLYYTWSPSGGFCWTKFSAEGRRENSNRISGRASCGDCFEHNIDYHGNDIIEGGLPATSVYNCQELCQMHDDCDFWSWHAEGTCYLKTSKAGREVEEDFVSGAKFCEEPTMLPTAEPTMLPTAEPTMLPTAEPTMLPTAEPTMLPTTEPTMLPTTEPTMLPTAEPTMLPTDEPTMLPTAEPTAEPSVEPTVEPEPCEGIVCDACPEDMVPAMDGDCCACMPSGSFPFIAPTPLEVCDLFKTEDVCNSIGQGCQWIEGVCVTVDEMF